MSDEPEDLLTARLIRQETEISQLKAANEIYSTALKFCDSFICQIIETLPEPIILRHISEEINDDVLSQYLIEQARLIDLYKVSLEKTQRELR